MSEHRDHTEFLKHCLRYDDSPERHAMTEKLSRLQSELGIVKRLSRQMGILIVIAGAILSCPSGIIPDFPYKLQRFIMNIALGLFVGSSVCLLTFIALGTFLYMKLLRQREACRRLLMRVMANRLNSTQQPA